jgi:RNA polymerase sigma-70 factor (ECF subfamily)
MADFLAEIEAAVPALRRYARGLVGDADRADDLVQDCLERAIRKRRLWRPTGPVRAWLFTMLLNLHRNDLRSRKRRGEPLPIDDLVIPPAIAPSQPGHIALAELARALEKLPAEQREALLLVVLEGTSYAEAAGMLDIPVGTLMSRLGRARAALRRLTGENEEPRLRAVK